MTSAFKKIELVGLSTASLEDAINNALAKAVKTGEQVDWFEVQEIRGSVHDGKAGQYQVVLKAGCRLPD